jgi:hypothetical protein
MGVAYSLWKFDPGLTFRLLSTTVSSKDFHTHDYTAFWNSGVCSSAHKFRPNSLIEEQPRKKRGVGTEK